MTDSSKDPTKNLQDEPWYHGLRSRTEVTPLLRQRGDFLVRANRCNRRIEVILSLCLGAEDDPKLPVRIGHFALYYSTSEGTWEFSAMLRRQNSTKFKGGSCRGRKFPSVAALVDYYRSHPILQDIRLVNGIGRPRWLIRTNHLHFNVKTGFLGKGNFAQVVRGKLKSKGGAQSVAVKMLLDDNEVDNDDEMEKGRDALMREARVMSRLKHQNVIKFFGVACEKPPVMIIMEFCPGGSLEQHLKNEGDGIPNAERVLFLVEASRGLRYLHHHGCIHRDLAARNCLISAQGILKISDFGLSLITEKNEIGSDESNIGTNVPLRWMAPETISRTPRYSTKSDVWAFGVMSYEIFNNGIKPWADSDDYRMISHAIRKGHMPAMPARTPDKLNLLVKCCWELLLDNRPEFKEIVKGLVQVQQSHLDLSPPKATDCTTNRLKGVKRRENQESSEALLAEKSLSQVNSVESFRILRPISSPSTLSRDKSTEDVVPKTKSPSQLHLCQFFHVFPLFEKRPTSSHSLGDFADGEFCPTAFHFSQIFYFYPNES